MREDPKPGESSAHWKTSHSFRDFVYWNLEAVPSEDDVVPKWLAWTTMAAAIYGGSKPEAKRGREEEEKAEEKDSKKQKQEETAPQPTPPPPPPQTADQTKK